MKEKYLKLKKKISSTLGLGTTISLIGLFSFFSKYYLVGSVFFLIGILILIFCYNFKKQSVFIEKYSMNKCPICDIPTINSSETRYYIGSILVSKEDFANSNNSIDKIIREINYYKCVECNFCLTIINSYFVRGTIKKQMNNKVSMDFNYENNY